MSEVLRNEVRPGFYLDSVALMRLSARLRELEGVSEAVLMIGTAPNKAILRDAGVLDATGSAAGPADLILAVRAKQAQQAEAALATARAALDARVAPTAAGTAAAPRTLGGALAALPSADLALISVPGPFAVREAGAALAAGLNVLLFSDNIAVADELALKQDATARGLLLMGPDCGTAYLGGVALAFANRVRRGPVGVIAASGTGLQEVAVQLDRAGSGVSQGIGVGGRDLSDAVGGLSTLQAIDWLEADAGTEQILLISKPPGARTAQSVFARLAGCTKPVTVCLLGLSRAAVPAALRAADTLEQAVQTVLGADPRSGFDIDAIAVAARATLDPRRRWVRGLFAGGTLCAEAQVVFAAAGARSGSNAPLTPATAHDTHHDQDAGHRLLDLGADEFTRGRPHPMLEPTVRDAPLAEALGDPHCAVVLLDVVLGLGSHADPAAAICRQLDAAPAERPEVVAYVCGTPGDPQDSRVQERALREAGVLLAPSNAAAAALALAIATPGD